MTGSLTTRVVLLVGAEGDAPQGAVLGVESTPLGSLLAHPPGTVELAMVSLGSQLAVEGVGVHVRLDDAARPIIDRLLRALGAYAVRGWFDTFPIGRLLNSIGPVAPSRVYWRALRQHDEALVLLRSSQVAIATDLETTTAAWVAVHRGWVDEAHYDHRALAVLRGAKPASAPSRRVVEDP